MHVFECLCINLRLQHLSIRLLHLWCLAAQSSDWCAQTAEVHHYNFSQCYINDIFIILYLFIFLKDPFYTYLLGLLAMIKCSICSYQCDNWYVSNWRLACHMNFSLGRCLLELAQKPSRVALAWHEAGSSTPFGVTGWRVTLKNLDGRCWWAEGYIEKDEGNKLNSTLFA